MPKHWTEYLPASWECEEAAELRRLGRLIKKDHEECEKMYSKSLQLTERIKRYEKLADQIAGRHFNEQEMEAIYVMDTTDNYNYPLI